MTSRRPRPPREVLRSLPRRLFETFQQRAHELAKVGTYLLDLTTRRVLISPEMAYLLRIGDNWIEMPLEEFRTRFYDTPFFPDRYAGNKFAEYLFRRHAASAANPSADHARRIVEEAQLFIEAAHTGHQLIAERGGAVKL